MAGLHDTDIRLSEDWQLTASSTGDVPWAVPGTVSCRISGWRQSRHRERYSIIRPGAGDYRSTCIGNMTAWPSWRSARGIRSKLSERPEVDSPTIEVQMEFTGDRIRIDIYFRFVEESGQEHLQVSIDRVRVEVVDIAE